MGENLESIRVELAAISQQLDDLPPESFSDRIALRDRRDALRAQARRLALADRPTAELRAALQTLRETREQLLGRRVSPGSVGGGGGPGGGGFEPTVLAELNLQITEASGVAAVEDQIGRLERELEKRRDTAK